MLIVRERGSSAAATLDKVPVRVTYLYLEKTHVEEELEEGEEGDEEVQLALVRVGGLLHELTAYDGGQEEGVCGDSHHLEQGDD